MTKLGRSLLRVRESYKLGMNPLEFLLPWEARAAEIYVALSVDPQTSFGSGKAPRVHWEPFRAALRRDLGIVSNVRSTLWENTAWKDYVTQLRSNVRDGVLERLKRDAYATYEDYKWSREEARKAGDYKETRVAAADHLDRIGATEKQPDQLNQAVVVVVRSRNVTVDDPLRALPEVEYTEEPPPDNTNR